MKHSQLPVKAYDANFADNSTAIALAGSSSHDGTTLQRWLGDVVSASLLQFKGN